MVRLTLVANPGSGRDTDLTALAAALRERGADVEAFDIDEIGDAARAVGATDRLVVAGGDGSIGLAAQGGGARRASRSPSSRPARRTTSPARSTSRPTARRRWTWPRTPTHATSRIELLIAGGRPFVNAASTGLAVAAAHRARPLKSRFGPLAYAIGGLRAGLTARPLPITVNADGGQMYAGEAWHVIVGGTGAFGGGSRLGRTDHEDELLDVVLVERGSRARPHPARLGHAARDPRGAARRPAPARRATRRSACPPGTEFNVDGEICELRPPAFTALPGGVRVVVAR